MKLSITDRERLLNRQQREFAERRLLFALARFDSRIISVELVVSDINGPRGGVDKSLRVEVSLDQTASVVITDKDSDFGKCISRIAERAGRSVARNLQRSRSFGRETLRDVAPSSPEEMTLADVLQY